MRTLQTLHEAYQGLKDNITELEQHENLFKTEEMQKDEEMKCLLKEEIESLKERQRNCVESIRSWVIQRSTSTSTDGDATDPQAISMVLLEIRAGKFNSIYCYRQFNSPASNFFLIADGFMQKLISSNYLHANLDSFSDYIFIFYLY